MAPEYLFIRHGESIVNQSRTISNSIIDYTPLTELGRKQAEELRSFLQNRRVISIYASPLTRARETAEIIASGFGLAVEIEDALREPYCGVIEGRSDEEAWKIHAAAGEAWRAGKFDHRISEGESFNDIKDRFIPFVKHIVSKYQGDTGSIIIVSHGSILMNMLPILLANIDPDFADAHPLSNCSAIIVTATTLGLTCLEWCGIPVDKDS